MPDMSAFDAPSREVCLLKRSATGTPQQAFVLLNDTQFVEAARVLAEKALDINGPHLGKRIDFIFRRLTGRKPDAKERKILAALLREQADTFSKAPDRVRNLIVGGASMTDPSLDPVQLAATTELAQAILNLDATVWKR
jgi:hypothetical protein